MEELDKYFKELVSNKQVRESFIWKNFIKDAQLECNKKLVKIKVRFELYKILRLKKEKQRKKNNL